MERSVYRYRRIGAKKNYVQLTIDRKHKNLRLSFQFKPPEDIRKTRPNKDGSITIMVRITINHKTLDFTTGLTIHATELWPHSTV